MLSLKSDLNEGKPKPIKLNFKIFAWIFAVLGMLIWLYSIFILPLGRMEFSFLLMFFLAIVIGNRTPIKIPKVEAYITLSDTFIFLTFLLYGGAAAVVLAGIDAILFSIRYSKSWLIIALNTAIPIFSTFFTVYLLNLFSYNYKPFFENFRDFIVVIFSLCLLQFVNNSGLAALVNALKDHEPFWETWKNNYMWTFITYLVGALTAAFIVQMHQFVGFSVILLTIPVVFFIYLTYRTYSQNIEAAFAKADAAELNLIQLNNSLRSQEGLDNHIDSARISALQERSLNQDELLRLTEELPNLSDVYKLYLDNNQLTEIPVEITRLTNLRNLTLNNNKLKQLPQEITSLNNLNELSLGNNQMEEFPKEITQLFKLKKLYLSHNKIKKIPEEILQLKHLEELDLRGNPLPIPEEILGDYSNAQKILNYYFKSRKGGPLNEARIIVIGESSVGKSSLIKRLLYNSFDPNEDKTHGIEIYCWKNVIVNDQNVQLNVWDFGGQEVMHATHDFFFSNRTLYILVVNARENQNVQRSDYWLTKIKSLAKNSPVIIVGNKLDLTKSKNDAHGKFQIDKYALLSKYGDNIKGFFGICCDTGKNEYDIDFLNLKDALIKQIGKLEEIHKPFPKDWFIIKNYLENMSDDFISYNEFIRYCELNGIKENLDHETLLEFLHDLGIVLSFRKDRRLQDTQIRNPKWVTKGVYSIVESQKVKDNNGIIELKMLSDILEKTAYPPNKHLFIIDMMRKFELCYDIIPDSKFLVPESLPVNQPHIEEWKNALNFQYKYETYFGSIISRFIVKMHLRIDDHLVWRNGVILRYKDSKAFVKADPHEKTISISINGNEFISRDFLAMIRDKFDEIHNDFSMQIEERVPIPEHINFYEDYQHLLDLEAMRIDDIVPRGLKMVFNVKKLLNNIESENQRQQRQEKRTDFQLDYSSGRFHNSQLVSTNLVSKDINLLASKKQDEVKNLKLRLEKLNEKKQKCDEVAKSISRLYSILFFVAYLTVVMVLLYFAFASDKPVVKTLLSAFSAILLLSTILLSLINLKEWTPSKFPEQLFDRQKKLLYKKFGVDEDEILLANEELLEAIKEVRNLQNESSG